MFITVSLEAQFADNMESYTEGTRVYQDHWSDRSCGGSCAILSSSTQSHSGTLSGLIPGDEVTDATLDLGNKIFGVWSLCFWMFIPENKSGYMNIACGIPIATCEEFANFYFNLNNTNPGVCELQNIFNGPVSFNYPQDEWFNIDMNFDISTGIEDATWSLQINGENILPVGTPFEDDAGTIPGSLGGIEFFSYFDNVEFYVDDFIYENSLGNCLLSTSDFSKPKVSLTPNPVGSKLTIASNTLLTHVSIYNTLGERVMDKSISSNEYALNVSTLSNGIYFVKISTHNTIQTLKIIKKSAN